MFTVIHSDTHEPLGDLIGQVIYRNIPLKLADDALLVLPNGDIRPIIDSLAPIHDNQGQIIGVIIVFRSASAPQESETSSAAERALLLEQIAELRQSNLALQRSLQFTDKFLADVSHEVRNPLGAMLVMPGDRERCLAAGANAYYAKSVSLKVLVEAIETYRS